MEDKKVKEEVMNAVVNNAIEVDATKVAATHVVKADAADENWRNKLIVATVVKPRVEFNNIFVKDNDGELVRDADGHCVIERDDRGLAIKSKTIVLALDTNVPCNKYDKANDTFNDEATTKELSFKAAKFQEIVNEVAPFSVTRHLTKFYAKTGRTIVEAYALQSLIYNAQIAISVVRHPAGEEYRVGDEIRHYIGTKYDYEIVDIVVDDESLAMFKEDIDENIAALKDADAGIAL